MKIGIITQYYNSNNYGGNLQAYALCKVIQDMGHEVEQISYKRESTRYVNNSVVKEFFSSIKKFFKLLQNLRINRILRIRKKSVLKFNKNQIPHSRKYNKRNITKSINNYDVFITGSDQVWHPSSYCPAYGLEFVPNRKKKISYAASIAVSNIDNNYKLILQKCLQHYNYISVREVEAANLLKPLTNQPISVDLDPTLLMTEVQWNDICEERLIDEPYVFCYFLGGDVTQRNVVEEYAQKNNCKIVTIPYLTNKYRKCDDGFGDISLFNVSPGGFISLIKYADKIFTDSFHAVAFSSIYKKQFYVFNRASKNSMESRIHNIISLLGAEENFCKSEDTVSCEYIQSLRNIDYGKALNNINIERKKSLEFLQKAIL